MGSRRLMVWLVFMPGLAPLGSAQAQWVTGGAPLCSAPGDQRAPIAVSDGAGGAIVAWEDARNGTLDLYVQRLDARGAPLWSRDGVALCTAPDDQFSPALTSDGAGGAIVAWQDLRSTTTLGDIHAQRVDSAGAARWGHDGVALCTAPGFQRNPAVVSDGSGGAIVVWRDQRSGDDDVYALRVNAAGARQWAANGVALTVAPGDQTNPVLVSDGAGGAIVAWSDVRVYAQRVGAGGMPLWTSNGMALCAAAGTQLYPAIAGDGVGGAIVTWTDSRGADQDIYAQRVDGAGSLEWGAEGAPVSTEPGIQFLSVLFPDGAGGAVVAWRDFRSTGSDLYAQHIDGAGTRRWSAAGVAVCNAPGDQHVPVLVAGEPGGVIFGWHDFRRRADADIYAQAVDASGVPRWAAGGVPICVDPGDQLSPTAVTDGKGGAIVAWDDARNGSDANIYAARIGGDGELVPTLLTLVEARAEPGRVRLRWYSPAGADVAASVQRRSPSGDWVVRGEALSDGTGFLVYEDLGVASGARYAYRLEYFLGGPPRFTEEVWIEVPSAPSLSLEGARPNPAGRRFSVSFSLPDDERATLDLLDLAGRRVLTRDLGRPGAGNHLVVLDGSEGISPGLYLVRLTQRGRSVIAKAVVRR